MYYCGGFIRAENEVCSFDLAGDFPAGTKIQFSISSMHLSGKLIVEADGEKIYEWIFGEDEVGQNGCLAVYEEGTIGEYRDYGLSCTEILEKDASKAEIYTEGDCCWFWLSSLQVSIGDQIYAFEGRDNAAFLPEGTTMDDSCNPNIVFNKDGSVTDDGDLFFALFDKEYISNRFAEYKTITEETGVEVMMQEFGTWYEADYADTLVWFEDLISAANENGLNWCGWDYFGAYSFYAVNDYEMRQGATYEPFSNGYIATELYDVFKSNLTVGN